MMAITPCVNIETNLHRPVIRYLDDNVEIDLAENPLIVIKGILEKNN